jgi:hypothetical protein
MGLAFLGCMLFGGKSAAQGPSRADTLFNEGLGNMRAGKYEQACPALAESYKLDPLPGVLFTVAECEGAWGHIATALVHYDEFLRVLTTLAPAAQKKHQERRQIAIEKMTALAKLAPQLTIVVPGGAPAGLVVKRNGTPVDALKYGVAESVDPGTYVVTFAAPGVPTQERKIALGKAQTAIVGSDLTFGGASPGPGPGPGPGPQPDKPGAGAKPDRTWAWVAGGVGVAGIAVGAVTGIMTMGKKSTIEDECPDHRCTPKGRDAVDSAQTTGLVSTIGFGVGAAGLITGVVLFLTAKPPTTYPQSKASLRPLVVTHASGAIAGVAGSF